MPEHRLITDPDIHEPKGAATAENGTVYVANGSGSGVWRPLPEQVEITAGDNIHVSTTPDGYEIETADTIEGLTNTSWDGGNVVEGRAATEGQLEDVVALIPSSGGGGVEVGHYTADVSTPVVIGSDTQTNVDFDTVDNTNGISGLDFSLNAGEINLPTALQESDLVVGRLDLVLLPPSEFSPVSAVISFLKPMVAHYINPLEGDVAHSVECTLFPGDSSIRLSLMSLSGSLEGWTVSASIKIKVIRHG